MMASVTKVANVIVSPIVTRHACLPILTSGLVMNTGRRVPLPLAESYGTCERLEEILACTK